MTRVADFTHDKGELAQAIDGLSAEGETAVYDGLFESLNASQNQNARHQNLILLSDGADTASKISGESAVELAGKSNIPVSVITLQSSEFDPTLLAEIADRSNGRLVNILSSEALVELYDSLASELHNRYQIVFNSRAKKPKADVKVEAIVGGERLQTTTRLENLPVRPSPIKEKPKTTVVQDRLSGISNLWLAAGLGFAAAFLVVLLFADLLKPSKNTLGRQLKYYDQIKGREVSNSDKLEASKAYKSLIEVIKRLSVKYDFTNYSQAKLEQAGLPVRPNEYIAMHLLTVVSLSFATILLTSSLFKTFLVIAATVILPMLVIQVMIGRRNKEFDEQLPETLDLLA
ncbi:MAG: hypothetical protein KAX16_05005, partial [Actinomycetia bacterium]|nr:hypothetical protein [Actinomycetes bacterium]